MDLTCALKMSATVTIVTLGADAMRECKYVAYAAGLRLQH
jgi:hypothetical protein